MADRITVTIDADRLVKDAIAMCGDDLDAIAAFIAAEIPNRMQVIEND
ncbi:hypothetical protein [Paracoccus sp. J55]|nr:hypothetical protein [Paracoccus sp. J55]